MFLLLFLCDLLYLTVFIFFSKIKHHSLGFQIFRFLRISEQYTHRDELGVPKALYLSPSEDTMGSTWSFMYSISRKDQKHLQYQSNYHTQCLLSDKCLR